MIDMNAPFYAAELADYMYAVLTDQPYNLYVALHGLLVARRNINYERDHNVVKLCNAAYVTARASIQPDV